MHDTSHENIVSQDVSAHEVTTAGFPGVPFTVPAPTCGLAGGLHCTHPLDRSVKSIRLHLCMHGHKHPQKQTVQCPWMGCSDTLQWMNIPRHTLSTHLGARFRCSNCGKRYTRQGGLARHTASLKCNGQCLLCIENNVLSHRAFFRCYIYDGVEEGGNRPK